MPTAGCRRHSATARWCSASPTASPRICGYSKRYQLPGAYSANRGYGYFPPPDADHDTVGDVGEDIHVYLLMGQRQSWDQMWPQLRTLTVS
jgi:hypothetical protein